MPSEVGECILKECGVHLLLQKLNPFLFPGSLKAARSLELRADDLTTNLHACMDEAPMLAQERLPCHKLNVEFM